MYSQPLPHSAELENAVVEMHVDDSDELNDFQACIERMQVMNTSYHEGLNFENKEVHRCFEILRKKDGNNV